MSARNRTAVAGHERVHVENDDLLWWSARAGNADAFATLFERHAKAIHNYCFLMAIFVWIALSSGVVVWAAALSPALAERRALRAA